MADLPITCPAAALESKSQETPYCRKQKSLGILCSNFLSLYNREGVETIGLDDASFQLGVERRRIYDIVNVLECFGILVKKAKCKYTWKGFGEVPKALENLKNEGLRENGAAADTSFFHRVNISQVSDDDEAETYSNMSNSSQNDKSDSCSAHKFSVSTKSGDDTRVKTLGLLTQNFVKLFLCTDMDMISLDDAAKLLLGDGKHTSMTTRAKVRRLYDITNVLTSLKFITKTHHPETRKPVFRWLGFGGKPDNGTSVSLLLNESKRRMFGTDLTNDTNIKRCKMDEDASQFLRPYTPTQIKQAPDNDIERTRAGINNFQFGPFAPAIMPKVGASHDGKGKQAVEWENLVFSYRAQYHNQAKVGASHNAVDWESIASTYRPQYYNQALKDLFSHYAEAWKSWYSEVAGKKPMQVS